MCFSSIFVNCINFDLPVSIPRSLLGLVQLAEIGRGWGLVTDLEYIQLNTWDLRHCSILYTVHSAIKTISPL